MAPAENRPDWDNYFLNIAEAVAERSEDPKTKVGCVIVKDRRIVSTGYNGAPAGVDWDHEDKHRRVVHAEANAIIYGDYEKLRGATLYCTHSPCKECVKLIAAAGIEHVYAPTIYCEEAIEILLKLGVRFNYCKETWI